MTSHSPENCPFCGQLRSFNPEFNAYYCQNPSCRSRIFVEGNRVFHKERPDLGMGTVIRSQQASEETPELFSFNQLEKPTKKSSKKLKTTKESLNSAIKYIIEFEAFLEQSVYPEEIDHYLWEEGSKIKMKNGAIGTILHRNLFDSSSLIQYEIEFSDGSLQTLPELDLSGELKTPLDSFLSGQLDSTDQFILRFWGHQILHLYTSNLLKIVTNSRLLLLPHQIAVAHTLLEAVTARFILADEVGLGKTIEAGIYIKEMLARGLAKRVLIITPATITGQWEFELRSKFALEFTRLTATLIRNLEINYRTGNFHNKETGQEYTLCTTSLQYARLSQCAGVLTQIEWDIVVFDEAHHLRRYLTNQKTEQYRTTLAFDLAKNLSEKTRSLLLLTATPIQLHSFDLYSLIELLNPFEFPTFIAFETARQLLPLLNQVVRNLNNFTRINTFERKALAEQIAMFDIGLTYDVIEEYLPSSTKRHELVEKLENKHFLSKYVIRNRRRIVFPNNPIKRIPIIVEVELTPDETITYNRIHDYLAKIYSQSIDSGMNGFGFVMVVLQKLLTSSAPALLKSLKKRIDYLKENEEMILKLQSENEYVREFTDDEFSVDAAWGLEDLELEDRMIIQTRKRKSTEVKKPDRLNIKDHIKILSDFVKELEAQHEDSKAAKLIAIVEEIFTQHPDEKVIIFTQFKQTLFYLAEIFKKSGYTIAEFHGDLNEQQKNASVAFFRHEGKILLSTEIGGEGRNFQFCHIIINYDLPWNPMRLEQRIGRLDRLGQTHNVAIYNFYIKNTVESSIVTAIEERIHIFEESIGALEPILGSLENRIADLVLHQEDAPLKFRVDEVIQKTSNEIETVEAKLEDFILDKHSFQFDRISKEIDRPELITGVDLTAFMKSFIHYMNAQRDNSMGDFQFHPVHRSTDNGIWMIGIPEDYRAQVLLPDQQRFGVFDLDLATSQEEYDFFALGHPYLMKFAEWCERDDFGGFATLLTLDANRLAGYFMKPYLTRLSSDETAAFQKVLKEQTGLNLFLFEIEFLGIIIEKIVVPVFITDESEILPSFNALIQRPHNLYDIVYQLSAESPTTLEIHSLTQKLSPDLLQQCYQASLQSTKDWIKRRSSELTELNKTRYEQETAKILRTAEYKKHYIEVQAKLADEKWRAKKLKMPSERQLQNVQSLMDPGRKKAREQEFAKIRTEVQYYEHEIKRWKKLAEDLDFDLPEQLKRVKKYRKLTINADFLGYARIELH